MSTNSSFPKNLEWMSVLCGFGEKPDGTTMTAASEPLKKAGNRGLMIALWSLSIVFAVGGRAGGANAAEKQPAKCQKSAKTPKQAFFESLHAKSKMAANQQKERAEFAKAVAAQVSKAKATGLFDGQAAEYIWRRMIGTWHWGKANSIDFAPDGTFIEIGVNREEVSRGLWVVDEDGTVLILYDNKSNAAVRMIPEGKLTIAATNPTGHNWQFEGQRGSEETFLDEAAERRFIDRQIQAITSPGSNPKQRRQATDNLVALGPVGAVAAPELVKIALTARNKSVQRQAIESLGEIDRCLGIEAIAPAILSDDPELGVTAEFALLKLLPVCGKRLGMNHSLMLLQVYESGNERVAPAIESAWAACGITKEAMAAEREKRRAQKEREDAYWAKAREGQAERQARRAEWERENQEKIARLREPVRFGTGGNSPEIKYFKDYKVPDAFLRATGGGAGVNGAK